MILIIDVCKEPLHKLEFVNPIVEIVHSLGLKTKVLHYTTLSPKDIAAASHIIICGTSLFDNTFIENISSFSWLKDVEKPVLGICAGMQIIGLIFGGVLKHKTEIGFYREQFTKEFLGLTGEQEVYHLHNNYIEFPSSFTVYTSGEIAQAVSFKNLYGVLFHPEVRNKELIKNFCQM